MLCLRMLISNNPTGPDSIQPTRLGVAFPLQRRALDGDHSRRIEGALDGNKR